jgi:integrase
MRPDGSGTKIIKNGRTYWRVRILLTDEYGRKTVKSFERASLIDAQNAARLYEARYGRVFESEPPGTVAQLFERVDLAVWSAAGEKHRVNANIYRRKWESLIGELPVTSLETPHLTRTLHLICRGKSRSYIVKAARALRQALAYAVSDLGWLEHNPADGMRVPKAANKARTYPPMSAEEYARVLALADDKCALLIRLIGECGMRPIEAERVRPEHLFTAHDRWLVRIPKSKTEAGIRCVPVPDDLARRIEAEGGKGWDGISDPCEHLRKWWRTVSETRLYDLRGWRSDEWRRMGVPDQVRTWLMGHTSPRFTQTAYETITSSDVLAMFNVGYEGGKKNGRG